MNTTLQLMARNIRRRPLRTALTTSMVVISVALLLVSLSWIGGAMTSLFVTSTAAEGHVRVATPAYVEREELLPIHEHLANLHPLVESIEGVNGVAGVEPRLSTGVAITTAGGSGETFAVAVAANESYFEERLKAKEGVVSGSWFTGESNEVVLGTKVAEEAGVSAGDELVLVGRNRDGAVELLPVTLVGTVTGIHPLPSQVLLPLATAQQFTGIESSATEILVFTSRYRDASTVAPRIAALPETAGLSVQAWNEREPWAGLVAMVRPIEVALAAVFVFLASLGIWNTMTMSVLERTSEIGVLRALGLSRVGAVAYVVGEAVVIGVVGGAVGILLGWWPSYLLEKHGIPVGEEAATSLTIGFEPTMKGELTLGLVVVCFVLGLLMAVVGSLLPAIRSASIQPVTAMQSRR